MMHEVFLVAPRVELFVRVEEYDMVRGLVSLYTSFGAVWGSRTYDYGAKGSGAHAVLADLIIKYCLRELFDPTDLAVYTDVRRRHDGEIAVYACRLVLKEMKQTFEHKETDKMPWRNE